MSKVLPFSAIMPSSATAASVATLPYDVMNRAEAAQMAGIIEPRDYAIFQNRGYQGLYGGLGAKEIHERTGRANCHNHIARADLHALLFGEELRYS